MAILNIGMESLGNDLAEIFETLQQERSDRLRALLDVQAAARLLTEIEAKRLERKHGAGDPRLQALHTRSSTMLARIEALAVEAEIAGMRTPPVARTGALVHGRVTDTRRRAAGRLSVRLVTEKGEDVPGVAPVEVDDAGYYAFALTPEQAAAIGADAKLSLMLGREQDRIVPAAAEPITIAPGVTAVRELALSDAELEKLRLRPRFEPPPTPPGRSPRRTPERRTDRPAGGKEKKQ